MTGRGRRDWRRVLLGMCLAATLQGVQADTGPAQAGPLGNAEAMALIGQANSLAAEGKYAEAQAKLQAARKADPTASGPYSADAQLLSALAPRVNDPAQAEQLRQAALRLAGQALQRNPNDPLALEVRRGLLDGGDAPLHQPNQEAAQRMSAGEAHFHAGRYDAALKEYQAAYAADPKFSIALVMAGDCFYAQKRWAEAEALFRRAAQQEPLNGQAWRFLADALFMQGRTDDGVEALLSGIAAHPSQQPSWIKLGTLSRGRIPRLTSLNLVQKAHARIGKNGKPTIEVSQSVADKPVDLAFWLAYATADFTDRLGLKDKGKDGSQAGAAAQPPAAATGTGTAASTTAAETAAAPKTAFQRHLASMQRALVVLAELKEPAGVDPAILKLKSIADAGQLEPALLLLTYRESYRADLEAWKQSNPNGVRQFVERFALKP